MNINYVEGNALEPTGDGIKLIIHSCNDLGIMGGGIAASIRNKWPRVYEEYRMWYERHPAMSFMPFRQGEILISETDNPDIYVGNLIGQSEFGYDGLIPVRYQAIHEGLLRARAWAMDLQEKYGVKVSIHMPRIGCGIGGGTWDKIEPIIQEVFDETDLEVTVYDFVMSPTTSVPKGFKWWEEEP